MQTKFIFVLAILLLLAGCGPVNPKAGDVTTPLNDQQKSQFAATLEDWGSLQASVSAFGRMSPPAQSKPTYQRLAQAVSLCHVDIQRIKETNEIGSLMTRDEAGCPLRMNYSLQEQVSQGAERRTLSWVSSLLDQSLQTANSVEQINIMGIQNSKMSGMDRRTDEWSVSGTMQVVNVGLVKVELKGTSTSAPNEATQIDETITLSYPKYAAQIRARAERTATSTTASATLNGQRLDVESYKAVKALLPRFRFAVDAE